MTVYHNLRPRARRPFIVTPYRADKHGKLRPLLPKCCPKSNDDNVDCNLHGHDWRRRKTGPEFDLLIAKCSAHTGAFTLYPPGYVPYSREHVAPVDDDGQPLYQAKEASGKPQLAWEVTIFRPSLDAAVQQPWRRSNNGRTSPGWWSTQVQRVAQAAQILALTGSDSSALVGVLGISALDHRDSVAAYREASGYQTRGSAVCAVLRKLSAVRGNLLDMILAAGFAAGRWGRARRDVVPRARSP
jgi:hypothetical protein